MMCGVEPFFGVGCMECDYVGLARYRGEVSEGFGNRRQLLPEVAAGFLALARRVAWEHTHAEAARPVGHDGPHMAHAYDADCEPFNLRPEGQDGRPDVLRHGGGVASWC